MGYHCYLIVCQEDLNSSKVREIPKRGVFKCQLALDPANGNRRNSGRKGKLNLGKFLGFLAARTQRGMTLFNSLLLLIIFLIFPSW